MFHPRHLPAPTTRQECESAPRSIVQTGDILNTERNAARVLFCESEGRQKGLKVMTNGVRGKASVNSCAQDVVMGLPKDGCSDSQESCFFAYLDILGFKNIVKQNTYKQLKEIVDGFTVKCKETIDSSRTIKTNTGKELAKIVVGVNVRIVSDSIYIWTKGGESLQQFDDMLHGVNALLAYGFERGLPLRGVVTYGELFSESVKVTDGNPRDFSFENDSLYGRALVEAYELESQMNWGGVILSPKAWAKVLGDFEKGFAMRSIKRPDDLFAHYPYLLSYDVPFKRDAKKAIAFNWNYKSEIALSEEKIRKAFEGRNRTVKKKLNETICFYKYTQHIAELCDFGLKGKLPIPDSTYIFTNLQNS